jgi:hypothetical protein
MHLCPVAPRPSCSVQCIVCGKMRHVTAMWADLDSSVGTYVCRDGTCAATWADASTASTDELEAAADILDAFDLGRGTQ